MVMREMVLDFESGAFHGRDGNGVALRIVDRQSITTILSFELDGQTVLRLLQGGTEKVKCQVTGRFDQVGKTMEHQMYAVPDDVVPFSAGDRASGLVLDWANKQPWAGDWDELETRHQNTGWKVIGRRWVEASDGS